MREARLSDFVLPDMRGGNVLAGASGGSGNDVQYSGIILLYIIAPGFASLVRGLLQACVVLQLAWC